MAGLTSEGVLVSQVRLNTHGGVKRNLFRVSLLTETAAEYPPDGVPMPGFQQWGMVRNLDSLNILGMITESGIEWKWDQSENSFRGYGMLISGATVTTQPSATGQAELLTGYTLQSQYSFMVEASGW